MPLTPLGKRLRAVLTGLRNVTCDAKPSSGARRKSNSIHHVCISKPATRPFPWRPAQYDPIRSHTAAAAVTLAPETRLDAPASVTQKEEQSNAGGPSNRTEHYSQSPVSDIPLEDINVWYAEGPELSGGGSSSTITRERIGIVANLGYCQEDASTWAEILLHADVKEAATMLASTMRAHGPESIPPSLLLQFLKRYYIPAHVLRDFISHADQVFRSRSSIDQNSNEAVFDVFCHIARHVRKVWPAGLSRTAIFLLDNLAPLTAEEYLSDEDYAFWMTDTLNRAMGVIVAPTAIEPIRNNVYQEAALVLMLQFMNSHNPTLQITRRGYRAVVLLQLAQRKTETEQQWAEVKALSWPPWKNERTAMDRYITADGQGMSKAASTLLRMRNAGFRPLGWERTAMIYAGWDVDRTPTIQTLALLGMHGSRFQTDTAEWAGRITCTRTAQEAWAAYLAYEDELQKEKATPSDQDVYLALLRKLHKEDFRRSNKGDDMSNKASYEPPKGFPRKWPLFPGDMKEVWPLPSSTHLHTYTRSEVPTMHDFYKHMQSHGIVPRGHCLAYLVAEARNLETGFQYLYESQDARDVVAPLIHVKQDTDISKVPIPVYIAFIRLLCRFPHRSMAQTKLPADAAGAPSALDSLSVVKGRQLSRSLAINHAILLLERRQPLHMLPYNAVLAALAREELYSKLRAVPLQGFNELFPRKPSSLLLESETHKGAVTMYKLALQVRRLMKRKNLDLDIDGFRALCQIYENCAFATWCIMHDHDDTESVIPWPWQLIDAMQWARDRGHAKILRKEFRILVGDVADNDGARLSREGGADSKKPPLQIPSFSLLHSYIRTQGWMADYDGMLQTVRWMHAHADELTTRQMQYRNGGVMMHRTLLALRVFLERSWLPGQFKAQPGASNSETIDHASLAEQEQEQDSTPKSSGHVPRSPLAKTLQRLRSPARKEVVDEVRGLIESVESWGGWPDDEAVERYQTHRRFTRVARIAVGKYYRPLGVQ